MFRGSKDEPISETIVSDETEASTNNNVDNEKLQIQIQYCGG